ncbi:MAG: CdaR family protein [Myxococcota bacterium]|nr:CdaR family protein [Myxococcota bacterium]
MTPYLNWMKSAVSDNLVLKLLAFALALTMVIVNRDDHVVDVDFDIPITLEYPDNRILTTPALDKVRVTLRGNYGQIKKFDAKMVPPISLNLSGFEDSQETFENKQVLVPPGLVVTRIKPSAMVVRFEERTVVDVPVRAVTDGQPLADYEFKGVTVSPMTVKVIGAKSIVEGLEFVRTQPISLVGRTQTFAQTTALQAAPFLSKYAVAGQRVDVRTVVVEKTGERLIRGIIVHVLQDREDDDFVVSPAEVSVTLAGTMSMLKSIDKSLIDVYVDTRGINSEGMFTRPVIIEIPEGVEIKDSRPEAVTLVRRLADTLGEGEEIEGESGGVPGELPQEAAGGDRQGLPSSADQKKKAAIQGEKPSAMAADEAGEKRRLKKQASP